MYTRVFYQTTLYLALPQVTIFLAISLKHVNLTDEVFSWFFTKTLLICSSKIVYTAALLGCMYDLV